MGGGSQRCRGEAQGGRGGRGAPDRRRSPGGRGGEERVEGDVQWFTRLDPGAQATWLETRVPLDTSGRRGLAGDHGFGERRRRLCAGKKEAVQGGKGQWLGLSGP